MTIMEIHPLDKRRCKVLLDENFALVLYRGEIKKYGLEEGHEIEECLYREILETVLYKRARERMVYLLKSADKTELQLRRKLSDGGYPKEAIDYAIDFAKKNRYVDDVRYAAHYVESCCNRKSKRQLSYDLQQKGLDRDTIGQLLEEQPVDEEGQIRSYLRKKGLEGRELTIEEKRKTAASLGRKGFSFEQVNRILGETCGNW